MSDDSAVSPLAPGFRFHPTDEELVLYYLKRRVCEKPLRFNPISVIEIYKFEPWDLPGQSRLKSRDLEWYFFSALETKYGNGWRANRATQQGYWKTTGKDRSVRHGDRVVGMKKTLVFHIGRAPKGERTNWVMHEYRLVEEELAKVGLKQAAFVLCRIFEKSGSGPKNGEQYGAPFVEEEWDNDNGVDSRREVIEDQEYFQQQNVDGHINDQDLATAIVPLNELLVGFGEGGDTNHVQDPMSFLDNDQKTSIGVGENAGLVPVEENKPEQLQVAVIAEPLQMAEPIEMDQPPVDHEFFEVEELLGATSSNYHTEQPAVQELAYVNAPSHDPQFIDGLELGDLNPVEPDPTGFAMLDEMLNYFDASDNDLNYWDSNYYGVPEAAEDPSLNQSALAEEAKLGNGQIYTDLPGPSMTHVGESSSSEQKPQMAKVTEDVKCNEGWDGSFAKNVVSRMLGSIPAPSAYAAELPKEEVAFKQNSATRSSSTVHVTAGMIHISGSRTIWSLGKGEDAAFLHPYDMTFGNELTVENLISNYMEPVSNIMSTKATVVMWRSGYYFILFSVLLLSMSCKIGSYIYSR